MKLLYLSCHEILEFDEVSLFHELGVRVFSPGAYVEPRNRGDGSLRPGIPNLEYDPADLAAWHKLCHSLGGDAKDRLSKEFVDRFDAVLVMHIPHWITGNWENIKHKRVIWRTIGQSMPHQELALRQCRAEGLKIVRYSPREAGLENFLGADAMIRFYKDPAEFAGWTGVRPVVVNFTQSMPTRGDACNWELFRKVCRRGLPTELYGPGNEAAGDLNHGKVPYETLKEVLRTSRAYFYTGTHPASYTLNFMEAWITGIPIVAIGPLHGNAPFHLRPTTAGDAGCLYEIGDLITHGVNGFISDDPEELRAYLQRLLINPELAKQIGSAGRATATAIFGKAAIKPQWQAFFSTL